MVLLSFILSHSLGDKQNSKTLFISHVPSNEFVDIFIRDIYDWFVVHGDEGRKEKKNRETNSLYLHTYF